MLRNVLHLDQLKKMTTMGSDFHLRVPEASFVHQSYAMLESMGFNSSNSIPCVGLCRDELTAAMLNLIDEVWSSGPNDTQSFIMHSLAGMLFLGKTGLLAAMHHAPQDEKDGKERYVFYCFPHIGVNDEGIFGKVRRYGIKEESGACGAILAFESELKTGHVNVEMDVDDIEQSILKQKMIKKLAFDKPCPSLPELTKIALEVALESLERLISLTINTDGREKKCDYAVFTGIQIHRGGRDNYVWPGTCYAVVNGEKTVIKPEDWDVKPVAEHAHHAHGERELRSIVPEFLAPKPETRNEEKGQANTEIKKLPRIYSDSDLPDLKARNAAEGAIDGLTKGGSVGRRVNGKKIKKLKEWLKFN